MQMWKRTATYDAARSSLFTWAVMISRHKAIDRLRSRQRQSRLSEALASESEADLAVAVSLPAVASATPKGDPHAGNSGHFKGGSAPCKHSDNNPNCPPFGG